MNRKVCLSIAALLACFPVSHIAAQQAGRITVYRCTGESGAISLQDHPCGGNESQQRRDMVVPADAPAGSNAAVPVAAAPASPSEPARELRITVVTPQPLFECQRPDGSVYESESGIPQRHWVPLALRLPNAPGIARRIGRPRITAPTPANTTSAGIDPVLLASGSWVEESCYALPAAEACARRRDRLAQLGKDWYLAFPSERDAIELRQQSLREQLQIECTAN